MANQENWIDRRQRMVRCKIHGLHYDPKLSSGCALCRKEGRLAPPPRRRPQMLVLLLALLGLAGILYRIFGVGLEASADVRVAPALHWPQTNVVKLEPEQYRAALEAMEGALFAVSGNDFSLIAASVLDAEHGLARQIREREPSERQAAADDFDELAKTIDLDGFNYPELQRVRVGWARLRTQHFRTVGWFTRRIDSDDTAVLVAYQDGASRLAALIGEARSEALALADPSPSWATREEIAARAERDERWRGYLTELRSRLREIEKELPQRPGTQASADLMMAVQKLEQALRQTGSAVGAGGLARGEAGQRQLDDLLLRADEARVALGQLRS